MKIVFADLRLKNTSDEYSEKNGMGGIASSIIYLSDAMSRRGHTVSLIANTESGLRKSGVRIYSSNVPMSVLREADFVIVNNNTDSLMELKKYLGNNIPIVLWMHIQHHVRFVDIGCTAHGLDTEYRKNQDAIIFVSLWQRADFLGRYDIDPEKCHVIRNACSPFVCLPETDATALFDEKRSRMEVAYVSAPDRGLLTLLEVWPKILAQFPEAKLVVYSGQAIYGIDDPREKFNHLLATLDKPGIEYRGALNHASLADHLRRTAVVAYPTAFEETSGIAVLEALASGCQVVGTDRGALPESTAGFARIVPYGDGGETFKEAFLNSCCEALQEWCMAKPEMLERLRSQRDAFRTSYTWDARAMEWESMIAFLRGNKR